MKKELEVERAKVVKLTTPKKKKDELHDAEMTDKEKNDKNKEASKPSVDSLTLEGENLIL